MPFDDAAEAKCADSESEDDYVESRLERVLREEASEAKPEAPRYTQLDDELLSDMQRGDEQMRRLVRHRLNKQREAADEKVCRQLLRKERFERGMRKGCIDHDEKLAALAQREEALRSGKLTTIVYVRHTNGAGQEVSGYIDIADRLKTENLEAVFAGKRLLIPKVRMDPRPCARATNCQGLRGPALTPLGTRVRTHTNARRRVTSHTTTGIRRQARRRPRQTSR